jgi:hypothetical protein
VDCLRLTIGKELLEIGNNAATRPQPPMVADELRRQAVQFIDLADLEDQICRDAASRPMREPGARPARRAPASVASRLEYPDDEGNEDT